MASSGERRRRQAILAVALLAALLPLFGDQPGTRGVWLLEIPILLAVIALWRLPAPPGPSLLLWAGIAWVGWMAVSAAPSAVWLAGHVGREGLSSTLASFLAPDPPDETYALRRTIDAVLVLLLAFGMRRLAHRWPTDLVLPATCLAGAAVAASLFGLFLYAVHLSTGSAPPWPRLGPLHLAGSSQAIWPRLSGWLGNPGWFAQFGLLSLPAFLPLLGSGKRRRERAAVAGVAVVAAAVFLTWSRAAWLGLAIVGLVSSLTWGSTAMATHPGRRRSLLITAGTALALVVVVLIFLPHATDILKVRVSGVLDPNERYLLWQQARAAAGDSPVFGLGPGGFSRYYEEQIPPWSADWRAAHWTAHSLWFESLAAGGVPALALAVLLLGLAVALPWRAAGHCWPGSRPHRVLAATATVATAALLVPASVQHLGYVRITEVLWWAWLGLAAAACPAVPRGRRFRAAGYAAILLLGLALVFRVVTAGPEPGWYGWERDASGMAYRWTRGVGSFQVQLRGPVLELPIACFRPGQEQDPTPVSVRVQPAGRGSEPILGEALLERSGWLRLSLDVSGAQGREAMVEVLPQRRFSPARLGSSPDRRWLGVAVGPPRFP